MADWKEEVRQRLSGLKLAPALEAEIVEELAQHLEQVYERALKSGASEAQAKETALLELSGGDLLKDIQRSQKPVHQAPVLETSGRPNMLADSLHDLRYALRTLRKNPGFTIVAIFALALGIGANTAIFSVVNTVLLRPLPYKDPEQLVMVWEDATKAGYPRDLPTAANFIDWRDQNQVFDGMAAYTYQSFNFTGTGEPERLPGRRVSTDLFRLLGVDPKIGRVFTAAEDQPGAQPVVLISYGLWQRRFGGDPNIVGKALTLNGSSHAVVGVMPASFQFPSKDDQVWVPIAFSPEQAADRTTHYLRVLARLKTGVTLSQAQTEMSTIATRLQQQYPESNTDIGAAVTSLHEQIVRNIKPSLLILLGAVALVLLIACANVANLLLARAAVRHKEIAVRVALGARRWRLIRQFLTESVLLSTLGGIVGLAIAYLGLILLRSFIPENIAQAREISIDFKVLGFTLLVSVITGMLFGLAPAIQALRFNQIETLKEGGRDAATGSSGKRLRSLLVTAEIAISLVLLIGAGLLINSFLRLRKVDPGFRVDNLLTMNIVLPEPKYEEAERRSAFYAELIQGVKALAGVREAAVSYSLGSSITMEIEGRPEPPPGQKPTYVATIISPEYFDTMGIPLIKGRQVTEQDTRTSPRVVVVSETMARQCWPNEDPIGKRIAYGRVQKPEDWIQVVGVVKDVRRSLTMDDEKPQMYLSHKQTDFFAPQHLVVRTDVEPTSLAATVRKVVWQIDQDQPVSDIYTMEEILDDSIARERFSMLLLAIFAGVAMVLAGVGIYGVMSYSMAQRTHEIGIRMALGAQTGAVLKLAVGQAMKLAITGIVVGLIASFALTRLMATMLFGITPTDPTTFTLTSLLLVAVAAVASYIPARRATKVDPIIALRYE